MDFVLDFVLELFLEKCAGTPRYYTTYCIQMSEIMSLVISFLSCFCIKTPVGVIILTWAQVARVTTLVTGQTQSRAPNICPTRVDHREFLYLSFR